MKDDARNRIRPFRQGGIAARIADHLTRHFTDVAVFIDFDKIPRGEDFATILEDRVASCDVFLAIIGKRWLTAASPDGQRRLHNPEDFVRLEIGAALCRGVFVFPVLVSEAACPNRPSCLVSWPRSRESKPSKFVVLADLSRI